jgi:hypothetical protein
MYEDNSEEFVYVIVGVRAKNRKPKEERFLVEVQDALKRRRDALRVPAVLPHLDVVPANVVSASQIHFKRKAEKKATR